MSSARREGLITASAVALAVVTQEATDKDGNELRKNLTQRVAVVIRKPLTLQRLTRRRLARTVTNPSYGAGQTATEKTTRIFICAVMRRNGRLLNFENAYSQSKSTLETY